MKKKLLMAAVGAALVAAPMLAAQAAPTVYGHFHMSLDNVDNDAGTEQGFLSSNSTRFGLKGDEDLGGGLKAIYQIESGSLAADTGAGGMGGTLRNTFMGFSGNWGTVKFGRHDTPFKDLGRKLDNFNEELGDARNIIGAGGLNVWGNWDQRVSNMVRYDSPDFSGIRAALQYASNERGAVTGPGLATDLTSGNVLWNSGPIFVGFAYEKHGTTTDKAESGWRLAGSYDIDALTVGALYEDLSDLEGVSGEDQKTWGLMAAYKMGNNKFKFHYYNADNLKGTTDTGATLWALGVDHSFSKTTMVYFNYAMASNDANAAFVNVTNANSGHGQSVPLGALDSSPKGYSLGMIMNF